MNSLVQLAKIYKEDLKYSGLEDAFDWKYSIFLDLCRRAGVPMTVYAHRLAFPTMLKGAALAHYYATCSWWESENKEPHIGIKDYYEGVEQQ
ncbi:hypothetical protein DPV78_011879 [Talaromyces pinophilus]|nr:hypothetical protein DPV78_011879 [Talaromyces pinophilus]